MKMLMIIFKFWIWWTRVSDDSKRPPKPVRKEDPQFNIMVGPGEYVPVFKKNRVWRKKEVWHFKEVASPYFARPSKIYKYIMPRNSRVGWWRDPIWFYKRKHFHFPDKWILLHSGHAKHIYYKDSTILHNRKKGYHEYLNGEQQNWLMNCLNTRPFSKLLWKVDRAILLRRLKKKRYSCMGSSKRIYEIN
jgi:hypothetical protein